jgi:hypothetical protein
MVRTLIAAAALTGLAGCVAYEPAPVAVAPPPAPYAYAPPPAYYAAPAPVVVEPSVSLGFGFGGRFHR